MFIYAIPWLCAAPNQWSFIKVNAMRNFSASHIKCFASGLLLLAGLQAAPALAQPASASGAKPDVEAILTGKKVTVGADKKETLGDAKGVKPGEILEYQASYTNKGKAPVSNLLATVPIPEGTEYIAASAKPAGTVKASLGDGKYAAIPLKRKVKLPDGKEVEKDVPLAEYKSLQWSLGDLAAGKSVVVTARVRVADVTPTVPATPASATPPPPPPQGGQK